MGDVAAKETKRSAGWVTFLGILILIFGILAIGSPLITGLSVTIIVGVMITVTGISQVIHAFKLRFKQGLIIKIIMGLLSVLVGIYLMVRPLQGLLGITLILGVFFILDGIGGIAMAFDFRPDKGWGWVLFSGLTSVALGVLVFVQWPFSGIWLIGVMLGIRMLNAGLGMAFFGSAVRSVSKRNT